ncbi:isocitrate lyase/PEP mutase family protein [Moheibacter lacus]|uniref:Isocitrate lyase/phosphoenolpyruvate mutase family protein n=1 Tax=Moheibacter lacus TaxID=2745851 RepID=A0A838ZU61_9FLAO|nr:isocitrate lyase/phosphoenolpyruvate mutase family protein [Moheibacter lacus]MBA5630503.1 isocitrate lyase/phosphoenolpyruvate mutase family protein [Moheibacter lacus]
MSQLSEFKALHQNQKPLLLGNVWDAHSAKLAEKAGFQALGTSSHAIAFSMGYEDGENIRFEELFFVIERILKAVKIPVSVDFEAGYSDDPDQVAKNVEKLVEIGVVGINLEDGKVVDGKRQLEDAEKLVEKIKAIKSKTEIFINARPDTYTTKHPDALKEAIRRANLYAEAGADGVFVPLIESESDLKTFLSEVKIPLNVFTTPELPDYEKLGELGVKRISHGAKQYEVLMKKSEEIFTEFYATKKYSWVLEGK